MIFVGGWFRYEIVTATSDKELDETLKPYEKLGWIPVDNKRFYKQYVDKQIVSCLLSKPMPEES